MEDNNLENRLKAIDDFRQEEGKKIKEMSLEELEKYIANINKNFGTKKD